MFSNDHYSPAVPKDNLVDEPTIDAAGPDGQHPRRDVGDVAAIEPGVAGSSGRENTAPLGVEGADGAGVHEVLRRDHITDRVEDDVDAVGDGIVERRQMSASWQPRGGTPCRWRAEHPARHHGQCRQLAIEAHVAHLPGPRSMLCGCRGHPCPAATSRRCHSVRCRRPELQ